MKKEDNITRLQKLNAIILLKKKKKRKYHDNLV